jgi:phosphatidylethanolamine/phosphatidyl-N-methylethanolamine N-methyltransferase
VTNATNTDAVRAAYRRYAPIYDYVFGRVLEGGRVAMAKALQAQPPQRLLEVGVGTGLALHHYPATTAITGLDISMEMLDKAKARVESLRLPNVTLVCGDAERLPFDDASFDCVTLPYVLSVTPHPLALLAELRRVCAPGGSIYIINHFKGAGAWRLVEPLVGPIADRIGFNSMMDMASTIHTQRWDVQGVHSVNLLGLSKLVVIRNQDV